MKPEHHDVQRVASIDSAAERRKLVDDLTKLLALAQQVNELVSSKDLESKSPEVFTKARAQLEEVANTFPLLLVAFEHKELIPLAVSVANEVIQIPIVQPYVMSMVAANAEAIVEFVKEYPKAMALPLKLLAVTETLFQEQAKKEKRSDSLRRSGKIVQAVQKAIPELQLYFSEANPATDEEFASRVVSLNAFVYLLVNRKYDQWIYDTFSKMIVDIIQRETYGTPLPGRENKVHLRSHRELILLCLASIPVQMRMNLFAKTFEKFGLPLTYFLVGINPKGHMYPLYSIVDQTPIDEDEGPMDKMIDQLEAIQALEKERPGAAKVLHAAFGIRFFSRYPLELLIQQYDERHTHEPYAIVMTGAEDMNNAFFEPHNKAFYRKLAKQLKAAGYMLRISEVATKIEFERHLDFYRVAYSEDHKAALLLIQSHGGIWNLALGPDDKDGDLLLSQLKKRNLAQYKEVFEPGFPTVFDGCSLGKKRGFAGEWSEIFDSTVYAPKGVYSSLDNLEIAKEGGELQVAARYEINDTDEVVPARVYRGGRKRKDADLPK